MHAICLIFIVQLNTSYSYVERRSSIGKMPLLDYV